MSSVEPWLVMLSLRSVSGGECCKVIKGSACEFENSMKVKHIH